MGRTPAGVESRHIGPETNEHTKADVTESSIDKGQDIVFKVATD